MYYFVPGCPILPTLLSEKTVTSPSNDLDTLVKVIWPYIQAFISGISIILHQAICLYSSTTLFWLFLCNKFWHQKVCALHTCYYLSRLFQKFSFSCYGMNFKMDFSISLKNIIGFLQFCSSFLRLFSVFMAFCASIQILKVFVLVPWKMSLISW